MHLKKEKQNKRFWFNRFCVLKCAGRTSSCNANKIKAELWKIIFLHEINFIGLCSQMKLNSIAIYISMPANQIVQNLTLLMKKLGTSVEFLQNIIISYFIFVYHSHFLFIKSVFISRHGLEIGFSFEMKSRNNDKNIVNVELIIESHSKANIY